MFQSMCRSKLVFSIAALILAAGGLTLRAEVPTAPSGLAATVDGLVVTLTWTASANAPSRYILHAGFAPGETAIIVPLDGSSTTFTASAGAGTYYVRLIAENDDGVSDPSNELTVVLAAGCTLPAAPQNLRAIVRGTEAFLSWLPSAGGTVTSYSLQAGTAPGQTFTQFATSGTTLNVNVGAGTYFARVVATGPCGNSAASNEVTVTFPGNTVRVADPDPGTYLALPDIEALIHRIHAEDPGLINQSCPTGRKYENNPWQDRIIDRLRQYDTRFGYNGKPVKTPADNQGFPVIAAGDEITYFAGAGTAEGSRITYVIDILFGHCGTNPSLTFRVFTAVQEDAFWTGAGRFEGDQR